MMNNKVVMLMLSGVLAASCTGEDSKSNTAVVTGISPTVVTQPVTQDSDDPAIWLHPTDRSQSIILGTDKGGYVFAFNLDGVKIDSARTAARANNVDVEYGFVLGGQAIDIAAVTDRDGNKIFVFKLPKLEAIDGGGIEAFEGEELRRPMGVGLYKRPSDGTVFAIVSRKEGPSGAYLWQYRLDDDGAGKVKFTKVRAFGEWSGLDNLGEGEIEAVAVDDELGYVYYSDEKFGIRKYHADPDAPNANQELALFGTEGFDQDREGISIYRVNDDTGYIIVSDQEANLFHVFNRKGGENPHDHRLINTIALSTVHSDGNEVTNASLGAAFPHGLFIAMSDDRTFHFYSWSNVAGDSLDIAPDGQPLNGALGLNSGMAGEAHLCCGPQQ